MTIAETIPTDIKQPRIDGNFRALESEDDYWVDEIQGKIPADLNGTFFRNGPGRLKVGNEVYGHWFDGDGMIARTTLANGEAHFSNRFIRTPKYVAETLEQRVRYRGMGTERKGGLLKNLFTPIANPANTSLVMHANQFLALYEGGRPFAIDPYSLDTLGEFDYYGGLSKLDSFSAHGKINPNNKYYYNFNMTVVGLKKGLPQFGLNLFKIAPSGKLEARKSFQMDHVCLLHDFAMTENYGIFFINSITIKNMVASIIGFQNMADNIVYDNSKACQVMVVDLNTLNLVKTFELEPMAVVHFGNAYEKDGDIHFDAMRQTDFDVNDELKRFFDPDVSFVKVQADCYRYVINLKNNSIKGEPISDESLSGEFPQWDWRRTTTENRYCATATHVDHGLPTFFNSVQKIDRKTGKVEVHDFGPGRFCGEPMVVAKPGSNDEEDFYILNYVYNGWEDRSEVTVIDAKSIGEEKAVIKLRHHIPQGFHGMYTPKVFVG